MAKYKSFKNSKQKIQKIWEISEENTALLQAKENEVQKLLRSTEAFKHSHIFYDSDWFAVVPTDLNYRNTEKGALEPSLVSYNTLLDDLKIPNELLAFMSLDVQFKGLPETYFIPANTFDSHINLTNYVEVRGDNELIYKGGTPRALNFLYSQANIDDEEILESHTKKRFTTTIFYTSGGDEFRFQAFSSASAIVRLTIIYDFVDIFNYKEIDCFTDMNNAAARNTDKILRLDDESFTIIGRKTTFVAGTPTILDAQTVTLDWTDVDDYTIRQNISQLFKKIAGIYVLQTQGELIFDSSAVTSIQSASFLFRGYWLFYDSNTIWLFAFGDSVDVDILNDDLLFLPDTSTGHGVGEVLPYTSITFKQNSGINLYNITNNFVISHDLHTLASSKLFNFIWIKKEDLGEGLGLYQIKPKIRSLYFSPSTNLATTNTVNIFDDIYTVSGTTYTKSTENHTSQDVDCYKPALEDVQIRIRLIYNNPLVYFTTNKTNALSND